MYELLIYRRSRKRMLGLLLLLGALIMVLVVYDFLIPTFGQRIMWALIGLAAVFMLIFYYGILTARAAVHVRDEGLWIQGPLRGFAIRYSEMHSVTTSKLGTHFPWEKLSGGEQAILKPLYFHTCVFIELAPDSEALNGYHKWFPRTLFGSAKPGIVCMVGSWLELVREIESAREVRRATADQRISARRLTLVGRILAEEPYQ